ncbi:hypothetical protein ENSA5_40180 [Enhygromyxa salina]|uniref:Uncharacterized protein n=1 Tax=Enhygromyxa salina TaxID=215803 RepID=A0A2S9XQK0_9BACT|nr:M66 family metalloprotease [Enhygromyxa salina]PRP95020.1 hypothetical protein ENSA5_40180 [Enhygromyxa salina]
MTRPHLGPALASALALLASCGGETSEPLPEPELTYVHAPGIRLTRMTVNQGVQVELVRGNEVAEASSYNVPLLEGRAMLVRAHYSVHADFEARELLAKLTIESPSEGVDDVVQDSIVEVKGDSVESSLHQTFAWYLEPDMVVDGLRLRVDVYETTPYEPGTEPEPEPAAEGAARVDAPALPWAAWDAALTADPDPMQIHVVLVPIEHHWGDCVSDASVPDAEVEAMRKELEQNNPVQVAKLSVREPLVWTETIGESEAGFSPILTALSMLHVDDEAAPYEYYFGLITTCDGYPSGLLGQAIAIPSEVDPGLGYQRVSAGRYSGDGQAAAETFVHEVGHTQGRRHVRCSGEAGVDPAYPYSGGVTGVWGFGIHDLRLRSPAGSRDYMTYCANEWVSDYGYNQVWPVIETLTEWALEDEAASSGGQGLRAWSVTDFDEILVGALYVDGTIDWWTTRGSISGVMSSTASIAWELDGEHLNMPVWISPRGDDETLNFAAVLPEGELDEALFSLELEGPELEGIELAGGSPGPAIAFDGLHRAPGDATPN